MHYELHLQHLNKFKESTLKVFEDETGLHIIRSDNNKIIIKDNKIITENYEKFGMYESEYISAYQPYYTYYLVNSEEEEFQLSTVYESVYNIELSNIVFELIDRAKTSISEFKAKLCQ